MEKSLDDIGIQVVKISVPKTYICPDCAMEQPVLRDREYVKKLKDLSLEKPTLPLVQRISAKCINPNCPGKSFMLPVPGIERYQRTTMRVKEERRSGDTKDKEEQVFHALETIQREFTIFHDSTLQNYSSTNHSSRD